MKTLLAALGGVAVLALTGCETTTTVVHKYEGPAMGRGPCCPQYQCAQPSDRPMYRRGLGRGMGRGYGPGCRYWQGPDQQPQTPKHEMGPMPPRMDGPKPEAKAPGRGMGRGYQPTPDKPLPPWCPRNQPKPEQKEKAPPKE